MSQFVSAMRGVAIAALVGGVAWTCPATATADSNSAALAGMLSKGYNTSNCNAGALDQDDRGRGVLAGYECGNNPLPGGPAKAAFALFDNANDTAKGFKDLVSDLTLTPCAPGAQAPDVWHFKNSPDTPAGTVACGTGNGAVLLWTNDHNHMVGMVSGSDPKALYRWWLANG